MLDRHNVRGRASPARAVSLSGSWNTAQPLGAAQSVTGRR